MRNVLYEGNIMRFAGMGWGSQRGSSWGAHLKSWWMHYNQAYNFVIRNNIFDRSRANLINVVADKAEDLAAFNVKRKIVHRAVRPIGLGEMLNDQHKYFPFLQAVKQHTKTGRNHDQADRGDRLFEEMTVKVDHRHKDHGDQAGRKVKFHRVLG